METTHSQPFNEAKSRITNESTSLIIPSEAKPPTDHDTAPLITSQRGKTTSNQ
ncbi:hypothetical protein BIFBRE_03169 [Bifidobacterium breve DSM 20213 = JCM 1192]|uniref:Uncharacterized protein n=1 Tax=Bifidobacterium breve DSM 20213 = JCM 1192 TaxID=518634 RepID=D4BM77_BIFBR|nr:hypothetical protein BIFBRE_03169 [Bifidobacterium breve DSM 20213 = JCM 1192]